MNIKSALNWAKKELKKTLEPEASTLVLLSEVLAMNRTELFSNLEKKLTIRQEKRFKKLIDRRKKHESVWYIIGRVPFWGLEFFVSRNVLVPRPETEILVKTVVNHILAKDYFDSNPESRSLTQIQNLKSVQSRITRRESVKQKSNISILDVGTGSGTIAVSLAVEFPESKITATDISEKAIKMAQKNAIHNRAKNIIFKRSDLFQNINERFDIITANLPYIPTTEIKSLDFDIHHYEPRLALDGGEAGVELYGRFFQKVADYLNDNGVVFCEIGIHQGILIKKIVKKYLPNSFCFIDKDLAEIDRIAIIKT